MKLLVSMFLFSLVSCSHLKSSGVVESKISVNEGNISLGLHDVSLGERLALYKNECLRNPLSGRSLGCKQVKVGEGEVTALRNDNYSTIKVDPGVQFTEGTLVEKIRSTS